MDRDAGTRSRDTFLQHPLVLQVRILESFQILFVWLRPEAALRRLEQALGDGAQGPGVGPLHEVPYFLVEDVLPGYVTVHPVLDYTGGGVVAVALHGVDPLRVRHPASEDAAGLFG